MRKWLMVVGVACWAVAPARATAQVPDRIRIDGQEQTLLGNPLEACWQGESRYRRPNFQEDPSFSRRTSNWRGYVATFEVADGKLWLVSMKAFLYRGPGVQREGKTEEEAMKAYYTASLNEKYWEPVTPTSLFPGKAKDGRVLAEWFTGELRIGLGKILRYAHMGYGSIYEEELFLQIKNGLVMEQKRIDNRGKPLPGSMELELQELQKMKATEEKPEKSDKQEKGRVP